MFHTFTCCCAYTFVIKEEVGPIIARIINLVRHKNNETLIDLEMFRSHDGLPEEVRIFEYTPKYQFKTSYQLYGDMNIFWVLFFIHSTGDFQELLYQVKCFNNLTFK